MGHLAHRGSLGAVLLPKELFRDSRLTGNERLFLCSLFEWANNETGWCNPGLASISEASGIAAKNIPPLIRSTVAKGWLTYVRGNERCANQYTIHIPAETDIWGYTRITDKKMSPEAWSVQQNRNATKKADDIHRAKLRRAEWWANTPEQLIAELAEEVKRGQEWIPQEYLDNFELVRGGDNSEEARTTRRMEKEAPLASLVTGVNDPFKDEAYDRGMSENELKRYKQDLEEM